jgi:hypothetical protein
MRVTNLRPLGVTLISAFYLVKSAALTVAILVAILRPDSIQSAYNFSAQLAPILQLFHSTHGIFVAPIFVLLGLAIAVGVWSLEGWAWGLLVVMCGVPLVRLVQFLVIGLFIDHALLSSLPSSPFFAIDVLTSLLIVNYLLKADVKRAFGDRP